MAFLLIPAGIAILVVGLALALRERPENPGASQAEGKEDLLAALNKGEKTPEEVVEALALMTAKAQARDFWRAHAHELWILGGLLLTVCGSLAGTQILTGVILMFVCLALLPVFIVPKGCEGRAALCIMFICLTGVIFLVYTLFAMKWRGNTLAVCTMILGFGVAFFAALLRGQAHHNKQ
jgi:hypothetical protein